MAFIAYAELNIFSLVFLLLIYMNIRHEDEKYLYEQKLFFTILALNFILLVLDTVQWLLNGKAGMRFASIGVAVIYCAMTPLICYFWSLYTDYQVYKDENHTKKLLLPLLIPICVNSFFAVLSAFYGLTFNIDANNFYHRGPLFFLLAAVCYFYFVYSFIVVLINKKRLERKVFVPLTIFIFPPFIGGIIQTLFYGVSIVWPAATFSIMIIFINIQNSQLYTDYLTGLYNRRELDSYMQEWLRSGDGAMLAGIMVDLYCFKQINDQFGHDAGDSALVEAGKILRDSFRKDDLICRYGGDEFVVVMKTQRKEDIVKAIERLQTNAQKFDEHNQSPYSISFSAGFDIFDRGTGMTVQQFLKHIDNLMYENKKENKRNNWRVRDENLDTR